MRYLLRDNNNRLKAIIYDRDVAETIKWLYVKDKWTCEPEDVVKTKVATVQPTPTPEPEHQGIEQYRLFDASKAITHSRRLSIHVSYRVQHNVRHYIAYHSTHGKVTAEVFDHDTAAHWFFQKLRTVWPAYTIAK
jgi:hypothetical protein